MASYADAEYVQTRLDDGTEVSDSELEQAETILDQAMGWHGQPDPITGRAISDVGGRPPWVAVELKEAMVDQVRYQRMMGPQHFVRPQMKVRTQDFTRDGILPILAPAARRRLARAGLINRWGSVSGRREYVNWEDVGWRPL